MFQKIPRALLDTLYFTCNFACAQFVIKRNWLGGRKEVRKMRADEALWICQCEKRYCWTSVLEETFDFVLLVSVYHARVSSSH